MTTATTYFGFENLAGQEFGGVRVERLVSRRPVRWQLVCTRCGASWNDGHDRVRFATCRSDSCGKVATRRSTLATTRAVVTATRSRDSDSFSEYMRTPQPVKATPLQANPFEGADPDILRHYLDYEEKHQ